MISVQSASHGFEAATTLANSGYRIKTKQNTVLSGLLNKISTHNFINNDLITPEQLKDKSMFAQVLHDCSTGATGQPTQHDLTQTNTVNFLAAQINKHLVIARTVVNPEINEFYQSLITGMCDIKTYSPEDDFTIEKVTIPKAALCNDVWEKLERFKDEDMIKFKEVDVTIKQSIDKSWLIDKAKTGDKEANELIEEWLLTSNIFDHGVWNQVYDTSSNPKTTFDLLTSYNKIEQALYLFLTTFNLYDNPTEEVSMSLADYNSFIFSVRKYYGALLYRLITNEQSKLKNKLMVVSKNDKIKTVTVEENLYKEFLKLGGTPETLFGYTLSTSTKTAIDSILATQKELDNLFNRYRSLNIYKESTNRFKDLKNLLIVLFNTSLKDKSEIEENYAVGITDYNRQILFKFETWLNNLKEEQFENPYQISIDLIAGIRFYFTSSHEILTKMNEAAKNDTKLQPKEAALLSTISYVAKYLSSQMTLEAIK